jgi:hypothetical protein
MSFCMVASWPSCTWPALRRFQGGWGETVGCLHECGGGAEVEESGGDGGG